MQKSQVKLSILIPTYNRENFVKMAIDSVLNQEFQDFEIICCDNASSDRTYEVLQGYATRDSRIKVFKNEKNLGPVTNWKNCLEHAKGEFVHWLWSDDWIEPNFYTDAFALMQQDESQVLTTWNYRSDNPKNPDEKYLSWQFSHPHVPGIVAAKKILLGSYELPLSPAAYIMKRDLVVKSFYTDIVKLNDYLDPVQKGVGVDSLMIVGTCASVDFVSVLQKPSVVFRQHDNISSQLSKDGTLAKLYLLSHMWFLSTKSIQIGREDFLRVMQETKRLFGASAFHSEILSLLWQIFKKALMSREVHQSFTAYGSNKVFFQKKTIANLDESSKKLDLKNKKIYLAPCNNITKELYKEFLELSPQSIAFIDNYQQGEGIISASQLEEYDAIFIFSPNYHKEIYEMLPAGKKFLIYHKKNHLYGVQAYSIFSVVMMNFFVLSRWIHGAMSYVKKMNLFNIGSQIVFLSKQMQKSALRHKNISVTPINNVTQQIARELEKLGVKVSLLENESAKLQESDYVYVYVDVKKRAPLKGFGSFGSSNLFVLYYQSKVGFKVERYHFLNLYKIYFLEFLRLFFLNFIYKMRFFVVNYFKIPLHKNERKILSLKKRHKGKRGFVIGNGPSLKIEDLEKLKDEITFAANKIYLAYEESSWRPTYYTVEDNLVMKEIYENIQELKGSQAILPIKDLKEYLPIKGAIYYPLIPNTTSIPRFSKNLLSGIYPGHTVTYSMMQMAAYMGIEEIYLIGVDFSYAVPVEATKEAETLYHNNEQNHFHKEYRSKGDKWVMPNYEAQIRAYKSALQFCEKNGIKVYNASRKTQLEVFERVDFDSLFVQ